MYQTVSSKCIPIIEVIQEKKKLKNASGYEAHQCDRATSWNGISCMYIIALGIKRLDTISKVTIDQVAPIDLTEFGHVLSSHNVCMVDVVATCWEEEPVDQI